MKAKLIIVMEKQSLLAALPYKYFLKAHKRICVSEVENRAVFEEIDEEEKIKKVMVNIERLFPSFAKIGLSMAWKIESLK